MQKTFLSNLILLVLLNFLIKPIAIFGIDAAFQREVGAAEYGIYFSLLNFTYLFNILLDLGLTNYNTKHIAQQPKLVKRYLDKMVPLKAMLFLVYAGIVLTVGFFIGYSRQHFYILGFLIFNQFLISLVFFFRSYFAGLHAFKMDILLSVLDKVLLILIAGYLLYFSTSTEELTIIDFIHAQTWSYVIAAIIGFIGIAWKIGIPRFKWSGIFNRVVIKQSFPYALLILLMMMYTRLDAVMIERLLPREYGSEQSGIYAQAFRLLEAFVMFAMLFTNLLYPIFSRAIKLRDDVLALLNLAARMLFSFALFAALIGLFYPTFILKLIYPDNIEATVPIFSVLMVSFIPNCIVLLYGTLLTSNGNLKNLNRISGLGLVVNLILNAFLIPHFGAFGAACTTLVTQIGVASFQIYTANRQFSIPFSGHEILRYIGFVGILAGIFWITKAMFQTEISVLIFSVSALILVFMFKFIHLKPLFNKLKEN
jgi:O-antigen/teichoic acid export membrane protein